VTTEPWRLCGAKTRAEWDELRTYCVQMVEYTDRRHGTESEEIRRLDLERKASEWRDRLAGLDDGDKRHYDVARNAREERRRSPVVTVELQDAIDEKTTRASLYAITAGGVGSVLRD
jgi:hypothetical protein